MKKLFQSFFIVFTLVELVFTSFYYLLKKELDILIVGSVVLYILGMVVGALTYRAVWYNQQRENLLRSLP